MRDGYRAAAGVWTGDAVLMTLSAAGVASLLQANDLAFSIVKWVGAGYLGYLAFTMLRGAVLTGWRARSRAVQAVKERAPPPVPDERPYRRALIISLLNPRRSCSSSPSSCSPSTRPTTSPRCRFLVLGALAQVRQRRQPGRR